MISSIPPSRPVWPRRRVLRALVPVPLLALGGCGAGEHDLAGSGGAAGSRSGAARTPASSASAPRSPGGAAGASSAPASPGPRTPTVEVSRATAVADAVALTFHGSGSPELADALLSEAEAAGARLTVLAVGQWLARYPQMARRVLEGGHELGNHTEHHLAIDQMPQQRAYAEIEACARRLEQLTGSRGRWFRQSQAQHASPAVRAATARAGYTHLLSYDLDSLDYRDPGTGAIERTVLSRIRGGDVVSMHLGHRETVAALPAILRGLAARGLRAVTATELFPAVGVGLSPAPTTSSQHSHKR